MKNGAACEPLGVDNLNPKLLQAEYAVRGEIAVKSTAYQTQLKEGKSLPFDKVLQCNIGERRHRGFQNAPGHHRNRGCPGWS